MNKKISLYPFIIFVVFADQWSKNLISKSMMPGDSHPIILDFLHITYIKNTGAAFSILQDKTFFLLIVTVIALLAIGGYFIKNLNNNPFLISLSLSMIIGGGIGNLVDRWHLGYVIDFIDFRVFPVFNVADTFVTIGCFSLILFLIITEKKNYGKKIDSN